MIELCPTGPVHVVYYVKDLARSVHFYEEVLGFRKVDDLGSNSAFLRVPGSPNYFDLGLIEIADGSPGGPGNTGLYHVGWGVESAKQLWQAKMTFEELDIFVGASDHFTHVSVYALDPDKNELELCWLRPSSGWFAECLNVRPVDWERILEDAS